MNFLIADTFTASLARLTGDEQKAVKTTAFDLQLDPASPGMSFHRIDKSKDKHFWSLRVNRDIRLVVHKTEAKLLLCYVDHHDKAYEWAERRRIETHPSTGAAQLVEIRERIDEIVVRPARAAAASPSAPAKATAAAAAKPRLFAARSEAELLGWGVPRQWLQAVHEADEDSLLALADHLPAEAAEALLEVATGGVPQPAQPAPAGTDPFEHPDAQRRFRVMEDAEALERALDAPWDQWTVFLHPAQRQWVERSQNGPARVAGSAGTGKTVVAVHRAVHLARADPHARVLLTTFSPTLANALHVRMRRLAGSTPRLGERIDVTALDDLAERLYRFAFGRPVAAEPAFVRSLLDEAAKQATTAALPARLGPGFLWSEWQDVVDPWQLATWDAYRDFKRLGRKIRLPEAQRAAAWVVFAKVIERLAAEGRVTRAAMFTQLAAYYAAGAKPPFEHLIVDEAQDVSVPQLRFLASLGAPRKNGLFFAGDLGQRIFQTPFSWKALGIDVRGRSRTLNVNYRTSHQIRMQADRLLAPEVADVDGNTEVRRGTVSVFNGPMPEVKRFASAEAEIAEVAAWLKRCVGAGLRAAEMGVFVRSTAELPRAQAAVQRAGLPGFVLDESADADRDEVAVGTMYDAKGLEFRAVAVMACDEEVLPLGQRIDGAADETDLREVYDTERHLLYVACTRARDRLLVTATEPASEFLGDLLGPERRLDQ